MLASSPKEKVLTVGFDAMGKGNGTPCASTPPVVITKVEKGACGGAVGTLVSVIYPLSLSSYSRAYYF